MTARGIYRIGKEPRDGLNYDTWRASTSETNASRTAPCPEENTMSAEKNGQSANTALIMSPEDAAKLAQLQAVDHTDRTLRLDCLRLTGGVGPARDAYDWIVGKHDLTPKGRILDAMKDAGL